MTIFYLPDLGEGLANAEIIQWHVKPNNKIIKDQTMLTVETTKSLVDIPSPITGIVDKIHVKTSTIVATGSALISFKATKEKIINTQSVPENKNQTYNQISQKKTKSNEIIKAQPAARSLAKKLNINLKEIQINENTIIKIEDVLNYQNNAQDMVLPKRRRQMCALAENVTNSVTTTTVTDHINIHAWYKTKDFLPFIIQALSAALLENPAINAHYLPNKSYTQFSDQVDLGIAVQTNDGLFIPKINNTHTLSIEQIQGSLKQIKINSNLQNLTLQQTYQPTFILSNFGSLGAGQFGTPMVIPPSVATLALGTVRKAPVEVDNVLTMLYHLPLSLSFNHRVVYGAEAINLLKSITEKLS